MAVTIHDVAREAGVSIATVSRVLNKTAKVKEEKSQSVEEAVKRLGFIPNEMARSLVQKKTRGVGVLVPSLGGEFFSEFLHGIDTATRNSGHFVLISASHGNLEELETALKGMHLRVDGLIIMSPDSDVAGIRRLVSDDTRMILINSARKQESFDTINFDNYAGGFIATQHLLNLGHRHIAMLKGPGRSFDARERLRGYQEALDSHGVLRRPELEISGDYSPQGGYEAVKSLLDLDPMPSGVFCANDQSAIGMMGGLRNAGVDVPGDMSIVGFDDIPGTQFTAPPLTSVRVGVRQLGVIAVERLLEMEEEKSPQHRVLPVELVVRQSTINFNPA